MSDKIKVVIAEQDAIDQFKQSTIDFILETIGIEWALVTDWSQVSDFSCDEEDLKALTALVRREVTHKCYIWELARDLEQRKQNLGLN